MARSFGKHTSFESGEISKLLQGQVDSPLYKNGLKLAENCFITPFGSVRKRNGFKYVYTTSDATHKKIPFRASASTTYIVVLTTTNTLILDTDGTLLSTEALSFNSTQLSTLTYVQLGNILYLSCINSAGTQSDVIYTITYSSPSSWSTGTLSAANPGIKPGYLVYTSTTGYAITSLTAIARDGQTSVTISGANPGPFTAGNGFAVGGHIYVLDGVFEITSITNDYTLVCTTLRGNASTSSSTVNWELRNSDEPKGRAVAVFNERLVIGNVYLNGQNPGEIILSASGDFTDYYFGQNDTDAIQIISAKTGQGGVSWIYSGVDLVIGTDISELSLIGTSTPTDSRLIERSQVGGIIQTPVYGDGEVYYISATKRQIRKMKYDDRLQGYVNTNLTKNIQHYADENISSIAYARLPYEILYACTESGNILAGTFIDGDKLPGWTKFATNSTGTFSDIITVRNNSQDELWCTVTRNGVYTIEKLILSDGDQSTDGFSDGYTTYSGASVIVINGLTHLEGRSIQVKGDGAVQTSKTVSGGQIVLDTAVTSAVVGLSYTMAIDTLPLTISLTNFGSYIGQKFRWVEPIIKLYKSCLPTVNGKNIPVRTPDMEMDEAVDLYTGDTYYPSVDSSYLQIRDSNPLPVHITGVFGTVDFNG